MVLDGSEGPSQSELQRTINMLVERQTKIDKRVERLETLEGTKWDDGRGCVSFEDYDFVAAAATARVDVNPIFAENGDYKATQAMLFWQGQHDGEAGAFVNLHMRINNDANLRYYFNYKYSKGAVVTAVGLGAQTSFIVGRLTVTSSYGWITVPFYPANYDFHAVFGDWTAYDVAVAANSRQEKGDHGGYCTPGPLSINRFDFFPSAGNFDNFRVMLYVWCPQLTAGFLPDD